MSFDSHTKLDRLESIYLLYLPSVLCQTRLMSPIRLKFIVLIMFVILLINLAFGDNGDNNYHFTSPIIYYISCFWKKN